MHTDVRVIDLIRKKSPIDTEHMASVDDWIALGHFSQMHVSKLKAGKSGGVDLDEIWNHNQALSLEIEDGYGQPVYILNTFSDDSEAKMNMFWNSPSAFISVTRAHAALTGQNAFESSIRTCLSSFAGMDRVKAEHFEEKNDWKKRLGQDVIYGLYRTLEFSDVIVVAKSDSAESLLQMIGKLYYLKSVGDVYSYFGISPNEYSGKEQFSDHDVPIPFVMTRFAVRDARQAREYIDSLKNSGDPQIQEHLQEPLMVTGTEDLKLVMKDLTSRKLCQVMRALLPNTRKPKETLKVFWEAIDDVTTRLSIEERGLKDQGGDRNAPKEELVDAYKKLYYRYHATYSSLKPNFPDWLRPGNELLKSLERISGDCTMYHLCYTLLDGSKTMVRYAEEISQNRLSTLENRQVTLEMLRTVITGMADFEEQMVRVEGELVHHPETRPLLFDIPVNLIELYLYLTKLCLSYFRNREPEIGGYACRLLIVPTLCETITVRDIEEDCTEEEPMLLYIRIPLHMMFNSKEAICKLVHEAGHFSGELTRERDLRAKTICTAIGVSLLVNLNQEYDKTRIHSMGMRILKLVPEGDRNYLSRLIPATEQATLEVQDQVDIGENKERLEKDTVKGLIRELVDLHKEAYADLAMVELLNLTPDEYCEMLMDEVQWEEATRYAAAIERAAIVIVTVDPEWASTRQGDVGAKGEVAKYILWLNEDDANGYFSSENLSFHHPSAVLCAQFYLSVCYERMKKYDHDRKNMDALKQIRYYFEKFGRSCELASMEFYNTLEDFRAKLLSGF